MAVCKVDRVQVKIDNSKGVLMVFLFNDETLYDEHYEKHVARYDFGRKDGDRKVKLEKGLYREPYEDGWKYTVNIKLHDRLVRTILRYNNFGFKINEDGEEVPYTYLRHNRKALGIHYMIERYRNRMNDRIIESPIYGKILCLSMEALLTDFPDEFKRPYFPTSNEYDEEC